MTCTICHTDKDNIEPKTEKFPICVDCIDAKVIEIAERKKAEKTRARVGGETGMNGEHYKGGQFLPSTTLPKMVQKKRNKGSGKQEIANRIWEVPPKEGFKAIYTIVQPFCRELISGELVPLDKQQVYDYYAVKKENVAKLANMWNNGHTWIDKAGYDEIMGV
jgi:hypothetical protein